MKNRKNYIAAVYALCCGMMILLNACQKTEFMPDIEGEKVPFDDGATLTVEALLAKATDLKIFYAAWQKSNVKKTLTDMGDKTAYSVFAPNDAAMQAKGLSLTAIGSMPLADVDSLVMFYTSMGKITMQTLKDRDDNLIVKSLLGRKGYYLPIYERDVPGSVYADNYYYRHYIALRGEMILINGKSAGKVNYQPATNGALYQLEIAIQKPLKTMLETLQDDGRFNLFVASQIKADEIYLNEILRALEEDFEYVATPEEVYQSFYGSRTRVDKDWVVTQEKMFGVYVPNVTVSTVFAPTDDAFRKLGFNTVEDILKFNERGDISFNGSTFQGSGGFPMDTLYSYMRDFGRVNQLLTSGGDRAKVNATVFFSNDLGPRLTDYLVNVGKVPVEYAYKMPLDFTLNNGRIQVQAKGSSFPAANIIESDILTLNGPLHVIDHLIIPKGFKFK